RRFPLVSFPTRRSPPSKRLPCWPGYRVACRRRSRCSPGISSSNVSATERRSCGTGGAWPVLCKLLQTTKVPHTHDPSSLQTVLQTRRTENGKNGLQGRSCCFLKLLT